MYIHLGCDTVVNMKNIIGIFDLETSSLSKITKEYLSHITAKDMVKNVTQELPKSFVVCEIDGEKVVYISQISSSTLLKRSSYIDGIANV